MTLMGFADQQFHFPIDSKVMRKGEEGMTLAALVESTETGTPVGQLQMSTCVLDFLS